MTDADSPYPPHYTTATRALLRFAMVMLIIGLLSGVAFQESSKKVPLTPAPGGPPYWDTVLRLAVVHGHVFVTGVLMPLALAGMLHLARLHGGRPISRRALTWVVRTYVPFASATVTLMLLKGYHFLLAVRRGATDMIAIDASYLGGNLWLRHGVYGLSHVGMSLGLGIFVWCLWRSLGAGGRESAGSAP